MTDYKLSAAVLLDIDEITSYLSEKAGINAAQTYYTDFITLFERLAFYPESSPIRQRFGGNVRMGVVSPYVVFYEFDRSANIVNILRVVNGQRRLGPSLLRDKDTQH